MAELTLPKSGTLTEEGEVSIEPIPPELVAEFRGFRQASGEFQPTSWAPHESDYVFDLAFDFLSHHETLGPWAEAEARFGVDTDDYAEAEDLILTLGREWSYGLMEAIGEPYNVAKNPGADGKLKRRLMR